MSKILFVEDELNSERILSLFGNHLTDEEEELLSSPKAKRREFIKEIFEKSPIIHVEYNFIEAIKTIESRFDEFSFFIIDRNLYASTQREDVKPEYDKNDVPKILNEEVIERYEGDYLFLLLFDKYLKYSNPRILLENFYFLTAYPKEKLEIEKSLQKLFMFFPKYHIIDKSDSKGVEDFIENKINKFEDLVIKSNHREVFEVFSKGYLDAGFEKDLLSVLKVVNLQDLSKIKGSVSLLRNIFEEILNKTVDVLKKIVNLKTLKIPKRLVPDKNKPGQKYDQNQDYRDYISKLLQNQIIGNLDIRYILRFLSGSDYNHSTSDYFSNVNFQLSNFYYKIVGDKIWGVTSEIIHGGKSGSATVKYNLTRYTLAILINILLDFLIWFGDFMDKQTI